ncbi:iron complex transport system permease protein [Algoriphagus sp. 4150]|uniref:FecCD family ABC transporter permease n=1 Tax=Algoriphagus sp. 4150 TaxID=2817756 RepID=UPI00285428B9|nr:iron ABC transporter permease [Algoriphagus sp. 4150]MDR7132221.1 iron complex transport system permease protein [Algoriphagus sp. 4150]
MSNSTAIIPDTNSYSSVTKINWIRILWFILSGLTVLILFVLELSIGTVSLTLSEILHALFATGGHQDINEKIIYQLRLPRALAAILGGAALGAAGLQLQTLFRNPLADSWSLGLMAGSQLGVALVVATTTVVGSALLEKLAFLSHLGIVAGSSLGCLLILLLMMSISRYVSTITLLIFGLMLGFLAQGLISVVLHFTNVAQGKVFAGWNDGSFAGVYWEHFPVLVPLVTAGLVLSILMVKPLNALLLGEQYAGSLGMNVKRSRLIIMASAVLLAAPVTAYCGPILFLGLVIPHLCRGLFNSSDHKILMPGVMLVGASIAMAADLIINLPWERHFLHLNAVNAIIGAPVVMWVILRNKSMRSFRI